MCKHKALVMTLAIRELEAVREPAVSGKKMSHCCN